MRPRSRTSLASIAARLAMGLVVAGWCAVAGCLAPRQQPSFESPTPRARAAAVARAATERDPEAIPDLIEALDDGDPVIRSWAIRGLEDMTGETFGYDPYAPQGVRDEAVERWVRWRRGGGEADIVESDEANASAGDDGSDRLDPQR